MSHTSLEDRVAIVTGGASGIGRATVELFLEHGAKVVVADLNQANGDQLIQDLEGTPFEHKARFLRTDVAQEEQVESMIEAASSTFGRLDILFNNAGLGGAFGPITEIEVEDWDYTFAVLVRGVFLGVKHASRLMIEQGEGGVILNTASVAGLGGGGGPLTYSAAKAAVVNFTQNSAIELASHSIRVNSICPGGILTPLMHQGDPEAATERMLKLQPWQVVGEPSDIAQTALFLAGDGAKFITGQAITVDGGLLAAGPRLYPRVGGAPDKGPIVGVNRGTTGERHRYRKL